MSKDVSEVDFTMEDVIRHMAGGEIEQLFGPLPARVETYDHKRQAARVQPLSMVVIGDKPQALPQIADIPVRWTSGAAFALTGPLKKGDLGWIVPLGADVSAYLHRGAENVEPTHHQRLQLSDLVFVTGGRPLSNPLPADAWDDQAAVLWVETMLLLGDATATEKVALAGKIWAELKSIATHTHGGGTLANSGGTVTGTSSMASYSAPASADDIGAQKVKAK